MAKKMLDMRRRRGKSFLDSGGPKRDRSNEKKVSAQAIMKVYKRETDRKSLLARRANRTSQSLLFVREALRDLLEEDAFKKLLISENLMTLPKPLADLMTEG